MGKGTRDIIQGKIGKDEVLGTIIAKMKQCFVHVCCYLKIYHLFLDFFSDYGQYDLL